MSDDRAASHVSIRCEPNDRDIVTVAAAARRAVQEIAEARGALGPDAVDDLFVRAIWRAVASRGSPT